MIRNNFQAPNISTYKKLFELANAAAFYNFVRDLTMIFSFVVGRQNPLFCTQ